MASRVAEHFRTSPIVWTPALEAFAQSPVGRMASEHGVADYATLAAKAVADPAWFWDAAVKDLGIPWMRPYDSVIDLSDGPAWPHFFAGGRLNLADYAVDRWVKGRIRRGTGRLVGGRRRLASIVDVRRSQGGCRPRGRGTSSVRCERGRRRWLASAHDSRSGHDVVGIRQDRSHRRAHLQRLRSCRHP